MITLPAGCACLFMLFFVCFPLFRSYIAGYVTEKRGKQAFLNIKNNEMTTSYIIFFLEI